jgi:hypothetical protein
MLYDMGKIMSEVSDLKESIEKEHTKQLQITRELNQQKNEIVMQNQLKDKELVEAYQMIEKIIENEAKIIAEPERLSYTKKKEELAKKEAAIDHNIQLQVAQQVKVKVAEELKNKRLELDEVYKKKVNQLEQEYQQQEKELLEQNTLWLAKQQKEVEEERSRLIKIEKAMENKHRNEFASDPVDLERRQQSLADILRKSK